MAVKVYRVGGCVRDELLGLQSKDIDFAVEAGSYEEMVAWIKQRGDIYLETPEYFTVRAHLDGKPPADFVLCRKDGHYSDGRRPDKVEVGTILDDLARRDFTMNAIAVNEDTGEYIDPFKGREAIADKQIVCVGRPEDRFHEDALRMLRAIRFAVTKGFMIHYKVMMALDNIALAERLATNVSDERKREELHKCFMHDTLKTLWFLDRYNLVSKACFKSGKIRLMPTMRS